MSILGVIPIRPIDIFDILIISFFTYLFLRFIRGTRATSILIGLLVFILLSLIGRWLDLKGFNLIIDSVRAVWVVAFVIVFQPEIRNALARIGRQRFGRFFLKYEESPLIKELTESALYLAERKYGALIAIERSIGIQDIVATGTRIGASVSSQLLNTIFTPESPLHDGAVVIRGDQILAAGCVLPVSDNPNLLGTIGMRHRAAVGLSEQSDAVVIVVSEERGAISLAVRGKLLTNLDRVTLRRNLQSLLKGG
ncbi:TIGR00159 family protein [candidate division WOR-3 bacterium]|uniref:Diadenylate cyclase n=1 Tax=candidate division WOR-3 bacterium TaxID=2052148 RepID=A0A660SGP7_UNCW3|nr:MAG: TIGR00159 family protein [candidate division WOR-3 bacterium]